MADKDKREEDEVKPDNPKFEDTLVGRSTITKSQEREIRKYYNQWAREVRELEKSLPDTPYNESQRRELVQLYYQLRSASIQLTTEINSSVNTNVEWMGRVVQRTNTRWLQSVGLTPESLDRKFSKQTDAAIRSVLTGQIYDGKSLSSKVWDIANSNLNDTNVIISRGIAQGKSLNEIARELERYLNPNIRSDLGIKIVQNPDGTVTAYKINNSKVDYRAQRLARTAIQHAYQKTLIALTKDNPFVEGYIWHADGGHPCMLCLDRDNNFYTASDVPLDHPNGQCSLEPKLDYKLIEDSIEDGRLSWEAYDEMLDFFEGLDIRIDTQ
jgi:hypothetical protein